MRTQFSRKQNGSAVIVLLILIFIMVIFVAANTITVNSLRKQVAILDKHQMQRLQSTQSTTNQTLSK